MAAALTDHKTQRVLARQPISLAPGNTGQAKRTSKTFGTHLSWKRRRQVNDNPRRISATEPRVAVTPLERERENFISQVRHQ